MMKNETKLKKNYTMHTYSSRVAGFNIKKCFHNQATHNSNIETVSNIS